MKRSLVVLALYAALAVVFTYPLAFQLAARAPAGEAWTYDGFSMIWNLWWFKRSLLELNADPFFTNSIFAPLGAVLYLHTYTVFSNLVALPLLAWVSPVTASNLILLASLSLCGYGMYLLVKFLLATDDWLLPTGYSLAAFVAGCVFAFTSQRFMMLALGHYNFFTTQFMPFYLLYLLKALHQPSRRHILLAALFLALNLLVELSLAVMLLLMTGLYWLFTYSRPHRHVEAHGMVSLPHRHAPLKALAIIAAIAASTVLMTSPYLLPAMRESFAHAPRYIPQYWGGAPVTSVDVAGMFTPASLHAFLGSRDWPREWQLALQNKARFGSVNTFVIGFGVAGMALLGAARRWRQARPWVWLAVALVVLSWGPILHVNGQTEFDLDGLKVTVGLPYIALHYLPILNGLRVPQRFGVVAVIAFAVLAGYGSAWLISRLSGYSLLASTDATSCVSTACISPYWRQIVITALCVALVTAEHLLAPLPLADATIPALYERIAQSPGDFALMDIPLGWRSGFGPIGTENTQLQYYQTAHGKRLISGFAARTPSFIFDYFQRHPILNTIAVLESEGRIPAVEGAHDRALAAETAYFYDLRYIVVHPPASAPTPYDVTMKRVHDYIRGVFDLEEIETSNGRVVYRVHQPAPRSSLVVDFGAVTSSLNRAEGWERDEVIAGATANWMGGTEARLFVPIRIMGDYQLTIRAAPFVFPSSPAQSLSVRLNGRAVGRSFVLAEGWGEYMFDLPARDITLGLNEIILTANYAATPAAALPGSGDSRSLSIVVDWISLDKR